MTLAVVTAQASPSGELKETPGWALARAKTTIAHQLGGASAVSRDGETVGVQA